VTTITRSERLNDALDGLLKREMRALEVQARFLDTIMDHNARATRERTQKIMPGDLVEKDGRQGRCVHTSEGYARVCWENPACGWTWEDFRLIEVVR
jgi:hypothetical protein